MMDKIWTTNFVSIVSVITSSIAIAMAISAMVRLTIQRKAYREIYKKSLESAILKKVILSNNDIHRQKNDGIPDISNVLFVKAKSKNAGEDPCESKFTCECSMIREIEAGELKISKNFLETREKDVS